MIKKCINIGLWVFLPVCFLACDKGIHKANAKADKSALQQENADSVTIFYSNNGRTKAKLVSTKFQHVLGGKSTYIQMSKGLKITFYAEDGAITSSLTAKNGRYFEDNNNVLLRDSVHIVNANGETLLTDELIWNDQSQKFFTEKKVQINTPTQILYGNGMEANQDFTEYLILQPTGIIQVSNKALPLN